jgi:excisionase family DNA binding protein
MSLDEYITLSINDFCRYTGIGRTSVYLMLEDGRLRSKRLGKKVLIEVASYREWLAKQDDAPEYRGTQKAIAARKAKIAARKASDRERENAEWRQLAEELGI